MTTPVYREDRGGLKAPRIAADGRLIADAYLTRSGVFQYRDADGSTRLEYRPPSEVFAADSLQSFALAPVTDNHPPVALDTSNMQKFTVGSTGDSVRRDGEHVASSLAIFDAGALAKVQSGKVELSCGYFADVEYVPGVTPDGMKYDAIQRNIRGNHVAIVDRGRAGPTVKIRMDSAIMINDSQSRKDKPAMEEKYADALVEIAALKVRADAADATVEANARAVVSESARADKAEGERDSESARADKAEADRDAARADVSKRDRDDLAAKHSALLVTDGKPDDLSQFTERQIKVAVIKRIDGADVAGEKSGEYVNARYDSAVERHAKGAAPAGTTADKTTGTIDNRSERDRARADMIKRNNTAWRNDAE